jgi:L-threonylcarbamoyladenylate synthase
VPLSDSPFLLLVISIMLYLRRVEKSSSDINQVSKEFSSDLSKQVEKGIAILQQGGIVAYPTDTLYGLGASMTNRQAVERIYRVKQRPPDMALPLLVSSVDKIEALAETVPEVARKLIQKFLPGALTIVLPASPSVPDIITAGGRTVAVRIPAHPVPLALIEGIGTPLVGTSANLSGRPSPLTAAEVYEQLGSKADLIIDDGNPCPGTASTIVDVTGEVPVILREGAISREEIERIYKSITGKGD